MAYAPKIYWSLTWCPRELGFEDSQKREKVKDDSTMHNIKF